MKEYNKLPLKTAWENSVSAKLLFVYSTQWTKMRGLGSDPKFCFFRSYSIITCWGRGIWKNFLPNFIHLGAVPLRTWGRGWFTPIFAIFGIFPIVLLIKYDSASLRAIVTVIYSQGNHFKAFQTIENLCACLRQPLELGAFYSISKGLPGFGTVCFATL